MDLDLLPILRNMLGDLLVQIAGLQAENAALRAQLVTPAAAVKKAKD